MLIATLSAFRIYSDRIYHSISVYVPDSGESIKRRLTVARHHRGSRRPFKEDQLIAVQFNVPASIAWP